MVRKNELNKGVERRANKRLNLSLRLSICDIDAETKNISSTGVYFEVISDCVDIFSLGRKILFQVAADTTTNGLVKMRINFCGNGIIIRSSMIKSIEDRYLLGIAVEFVRKLDVLDCFSVKTYDQIEEDILNYLKRG